MEEARLRALKLTVSATFGDFASKVEMEEARLRALKLF